MPFCCPGSPRCPQRGLTYRTNDLYWLWLTQGKGSPHASPVSSVCCISSLWPVPALRGGGWQVLFLQLRLLRQRCLPGSWHRGGSRTDWSTCPAPPSPSVPPSGLALLPFSVFTSLFKPPQLTGTSRDLLGYHLRCDTFCGPQAALKAVTGLPKHQHSQG